MTHPHRPRSITCLVLAIVALAVLAPLPAGALTVTQIRAFSGSTLDQIGVAPFDPDLGTLDAVHVSIDGVLTVTGVTGLNLAGSTPVPYGFQVDVIQSFVGLANKYFDLEQATFRFGGVALGTGEPFGFSTQFTYDLEFDFVTDLLGFDVPSVSTTSGALVPPPGGVTGTRGAFVDNGIPIDEIDLIQQALVSVQGGQTPVLISSFSAGGTLQIVYEYTPVAEPATAALLGTSLLLGAGARMLGRRRR